MTFDKILLATTGLVTTLIGGVDLTMKILLILMAVDIFTGVLKALGGYRFTSKDMRQGLVAKAGFIVVIILCYQLDMLMGNSEPIIRTMSTIFYITVEGSSIIENLGLMGVPVPKFVAERLEQLNTDNNTNNTDRGI